MIIIGGKAVSVEISHEVRNSYRNCILLLLLSNEQKMPQVFKF